MANDASKKDIFVYLNILNTDYFVGTLSIHSDNNSEFSTFEYSDKWLSNKSAFPLSEELPLKKEVFRSNSPKSFEIFYMQSYIDVIDFYYEYLLIYLKKHNLLNDGEDFNTEELIKYLNNSDSLSSKFVEDSIISIASSIIYQNDYIRNGAFRFKLEKDGEFMQIFDKKYIPKIVEIPKIIEIIDKIKAQKDSLDDVKRLQACIAGLDGRKPKTSAFDREGNLCIAKLNPITDKTNVETGIESFALHLANKLTLNVQNYTIEETSDGLKYLLVRRFDRIGEKRLPYFRLSTFISDIDFSDDKMIAYYITKICKKNSKKNLNEFFKRKLFRIAITNTKPMIPNTGFLYDENGWNLSPDFDINIGYERFRTLSDTISAEKFNIDTTISEFNELLSNSFYYRISHKKAKKFVSELKKALKNWELEAQNFGFNEENLFRLKIYNKALDKMKYSFKKRKGKC